MKEWCAEIGTATSKPPAAVNTPNLNLIAAPSIRVTSTSCAKPCRSAPAICRNDKTGSEVCAPKDTIYLRHLMHCIGTCAEYPDRSGNGISWRPLLQVQARLPNSVYDTPREIADENTG